MANPPAIDWTMALGASCLGVFVTWLIRLTVTGNKNVTVRIITSLLNVALGTVVFGALKHWVQGSQPFPREFIFYFVGLALGILLLPAFDWLGGFFERAAAEENTLNILGNIRKAIESENLSLKSNPEAVTALRRIDKQLVEAIKKIDL